MKRTLTTLSEAVVDSLDEKYELIYVDQSDQLTDDQVANVVRGDFEKVWESLDEWASDQKYEAAKEIVNAQADAVIERWETEDEGKCVNCLAPISETPDPDMPWLHTATGNSYCDVTDAASAIANAGKPDRTEAEEIGDSYTELRDDFEGTQEWDEVRYVIEERDQSDPGKELARLTPPVLLRITAIDEDHGFAFEPVSPVQVMNRLGVDVEAMSDEDYEHNRAQIQYALDNASPEYSVLMGYWLVGADVQELYTLPGDAETEIEIENPHLHLGNPFAGSGYMTEEALRMTIKVKREDLRTDKDAFGYSMESIYGGLNPSDFEATIRPIKTEADTAV